MDTLNRSEQFCPVCGYELWFAPWVGISPSDEICPCCGIQFGYDDAQDGEDENRQIFIKLFL